MFLIIQHTKKANLRTYMAIFIENRLYVFYHYLSRHRADGRFHRSVNADGCRGHSLNYSSHWLNDIAIETENFSTR